MVYTNSKKCRVDILKKNSENIYFAFFFKKTIFIEWDPSIYLSINLSIYHSIYQSDCLINLLPIFIYLSVCISIFLFIWLCNCFHVPISQSIYLSIYLKFIPPSVHVCLSVCLSEPLWNSLSKNRHEQSEIDR